MAVGDIACAPSTAVTARECRHGDVAQVISQSNPNYFIPLGDLQYPNATYAEFTGAGAYNSVLGTLKSRTLPVIGTTSTGTRLVPVRGTSTTSTGSELRRGATAPEAAATTR